jgi:ElaB/YqjD/DUF883 family membrane-anchored ribosome-binding protein
MSTSTTIADEPANGASNPPEAVAGEFKKLIADVEDLVARVADVKNPDVIRLRNKVQDRLAAARSTISAGTETVWRQTRQMAGATDDYVRGSPWQSVGIAALLGLAIGYVFGRRN